MNPYQVLGIVVLTTLVVLAIVYFLVPYLKGKGVQVVNVLNKVNDGIDTLDAGLTTINNVAAVPYFKLIDKIFDIARLGTKNAERLYKMGELEKDARKENVEKYVVEILKNANVEVNEDVKKIINRAIEEGVKLLPKTHQ